jgi:hypothetical protein
MLTFVGESSQPFCRDCVNWAGNLFCHALNVSFTISDIGDLYSICDVSPYLGNISPPFAGAATSATACCGLLAHLDVMGALPPWQRFLSS